MYYAARPVRRGLRGTSVRHGLCGMACTAHVGTAVGRFRAHLSEPPRQQRDARGFLKRYEAVYGQHMDGRTHQQVGYGIPHRTYRS